MEELRADIWTKNSLRSFIGLLLALTLLIKLWVASDDLRSTSFHDIFHLKALLKTMLLCASVVFVLLGYFPHFSRACIPSSRESSCCCKLGKWELPHRQGELYR